MKNCYTCNEYGACFEYTYSCVDWKEPEKLTPLRLNINSFDKLWQRIHSDEVRALDKEILIKRIKANTIRLKGEDSEAFLEKAVNSMQEQPTQDLLTVSGT